jgi:uncharacterized lipoprotein
MKNLIKSLILLFTVIFISSCSSTGMSDGQQDINDFRKEAVMKRLIKRSP